MTQAQDTTLVVLASLPVDVRVASALQSAARALGYADGCAIVQLADLGEPRRFVFETDPWAVIAIDDASIDALRTAFELDAQAFSPDVPARVTGYALVAVPGFATCLDDPEAKRIAWARMQAAAHPGNPLD
ncbi:MAG: hypothetical protein V8R08_04450 [Coriobacteriales bacterium]